MKTLKERDRQYIASALNAALDDKNLDEVSAQKLLEGARDLINSRTLPLDLEEIQVGFNALCERFDGIEYVPLRQGVKIDCIIAYGQIIAPTPQYETQIPILERFVHYADPEAVARFHHSAVGVRFVTKASQEETEE